MLHRSPLKSAVMTVSQWSLVSGLRVGTIAILLPLFLVGTGGRSIAAETIDRVPVKQSSFKDQISSQLLAAAPQQIERRTALVIGNGNYGTMGNLKNPTNDAEDIEKALRELGFDVTLVSNANLRKMNEAIAEFNQKIQKGGVGLFYYAGHAMQLQGENYLIPIEAKLDSEGEAQYETVALGKVLVGMENAKNRVNLVLLDACRNNPFSRSWRDSSRGLAVQSARGTLISFATGANQLAKDGDGRNSPYTSSVLQYIQDPGIPIEQMFKRVRQSVVEKTNNKQSPWEQNNLVGDFFFKPIDSIIPTEAAIQRPLLPSKPIAINPSPKTASDGLTANDLFQRGLEKYKSKDYQGAIADYSKAIQLKPDYAEAYNNRGNARNELYDHQGAIEDYNQVIRYKPRYSIAYFNRANTRSVIANRPEYNLAIQDYDQAIRNDPSDYDFYFMRGMTRAESGDYQGALKDYEQAVRVQPKISYSSIKDKDVKYMKWHGVYRDAYVAMASAYENIGDRQNALLNYNQAIEFNPDEYTHHRRGKLRSVLGDVKGSIADYTISINVLLSQEYGNPDYVLSLRAEALESIGDIKGAIADFQIIADRSKRFSDSKSYETAFNKIKQLQLKLK